MANLLNFCSAYKIVHLCDLIKGNELQVGPGPKWVLHIQYIELSVPHTVNLIDSTYNFLLQSYIKLFTWQIKQ